MSFAIVTTRRFKATGKRLDLGCGQKCRPGFIGLDSREYGQALLWDAREGLPFPDNSIEEIWSSHFIEHLTDAEIVDVFQEMLRICKPTARVELHCPHETTLEAYYHNHLSYWSVTRIKGMVMGFKGSAPRYGGKYFSIVSATQVGIELQAILKVEKL